MEIFIIILLLICVVSILKIKTSIFDFNKVSIENMTCDRNDTKSCIYDDMIVAGKNCIYGKTNNNSININDAISYDTNELSQLNDFDFKRYILNNAMDNSKGYLQSSSVTHINKCMKEIDTSLLDLNLNGIKAQYLRIIDLDKSDWINAAKFEFFSKNIDISALQSHRKTELNYTSIDIGSEFEINKVRISSNRSGNKKWIFLLINKKNDIVFSELFTNIPNTPIDINTETSKTVDINIPLGCYNNSSNINMYHGNNYNELSCSNRAKDNNHKYFRLENNNQCFTGSVFKIDNEPCKNEKSQVYLASANSLLAKSGIYDLLIKKGSYQPLSNTILGYVSLSENYAINFNIKLESTKPYDTQIFVITSISDENPSSPDDNEQIVRSDKEEFSRIPGAWICKDTTNLNYVYSTKNNYNNILSNCTKSLPLDEDVNVVLIKSESNFKIYINTELVENIDKPEIKNSIKTKGRAAIYSSYNYEGAPCTITDFMYLSSNSPLSIENLNKVKNDENIEIAKKIVINEENGSLLNNYILKKLGTSKERVKLLYKGSRDGFNANAFHSLCDNQGPTITVIKANNRISGGYTAVPWASRDKFVHVPVGDAFLFTTENLNVVKYYNLRFENYSLVDYSSYGPTFGLGYDLHIPLNTYGSPSTSKFTYEANDTKLFGSKSFNVDDIEVYSTQLIPYVKKTNNLLTNNWWS
jgi:hypothetical protein